MSIELPKTAREYFAAANAGDVTHVVALFADEAAVKDEGAEVHGRAAIHDWVARTTREYAATAIPEQCDHSGHVSIVTALVSGDFPGSPVRLTYHFEINDDEIVRLEIH